MNSIFSDNPRNLVDFRFHMGIYFKWCILLKRIQTFLPEKCQKYGVKEVEYKLFLNYKVKTKYGESTVVQYFSEIPKYKKALKKGILKIDPAADFEGVILTFKGAAAKDFHLKAFVFCSLNENDFIKVKDLTEYPNQEDLELQYYRGDIYSPAAYAYGEEQPKKIDWT